MIRTVAIILIFAAILVYSVSHFAGHKGNGALDDTAGLQLSVPTEYRIIHRAAWYGTPDYTDVAVRFLHYWQQGDSLLAIHLGDGPEMAIYTLNRAENILQERIRLSSGVIYQMTWRANIGLRLRYAMQHGDFNAPGCSPGELQNLYH